MDNFEEEFAIPFKICFDLLSRSDVNILKRKRSLLAKFLNVFLISCIVIYYAGIFTYEVKAFSGELEFFELAVIVPVFMVCTQSILKAAVVLSNKNKIRGIIQQLGSTWRTDNLTHTQIEQKNKMLQQLNHFHSVFYWMNILGSWQYMLAPLFETVFRRFILQQQSELLLPFFCSFPFDQTSTWTRYIAVYIFTVYSMIHLIYIYLGAEFLMITLCALLNIEFSLLQVDLRHVKPSSRGDVAYNNDVTIYNDKEAKNIIQGHQRLIMLTTQLNEIFNRMIFFNLLFATITICFFGFVATKARGATDMVNNFVGVVASMVPIFNLCYYGELLTGASAGIADAAYESLWYEGSVTHQKMLAFIIYRSQRPCCLTSLKYVPVSLNTFTTVMSTTWSYFSLANSMYEDN